MHCGAAKQPTSLPVARPARRCAAGARPVAAFLVALLLAPLAPHAEPLPPPSSVQSPPSPPEATRDDVHDAAAMARFLDRLMLAESGGRDLARNPRSTALGPFQFIESTFLEVARRHFAGETQALPPAAILQLRTNRPFARRAAEAFTRDNAAHLAQAGLVPSFANLRLAFLVGPGGAVRVLTADAREPVIRILGTGVVQANPFMAGMGAGDLVAWSGRNLAAADIAGTELATDPARLARLAARPPRPAVAVRCKRGLASCRRWVALATQRVSRQQASAAGHRARRR